MQSDTELEDLVGSSSYNINDITNNIHNTFTNLMTSKEAKIQLDNISIDLVTKAIKRDISKDTDSSFENLRSSMELDKFINASLTILNHIGDVFI